jgi:hypothetical protein
VAWRALFGKRWRVGQGLSVVSPCYSGCSNLSSVLACSGLETWVVIELGVVGWADLLRDA